jgi:hypothetical protein
MDDMGLPDIAQKQARQKQTSKEAICEISFVAPFSFYNGRWTVPLPKGGLSGRMCGWFVSARNFYLSVFPVFLPPPEYSIILRLRASRRFLFPPLNRNLPRVV